MKIINMKRYYYPIYRKDTFMKVPDEVAEALEEAWHIEHRQKNKKSSYKILSLDASEGLEYHALFHGQPPEELLFQAEADADQEAVFTHLREAVTHLTQTQARRLRARFELGMKYWEIAQIEGVSVSDISQSVRAGIRKLRKIFLLNNWMNGSTGSVTTKKGGFTKS